MKTHRLYLCCMLSSIVLAIAAPAIGQLPNRPRVAPWEIEPTEETKRRIASGEVWESPPFEVVLSAPRGKSRAYPLKVTPLSIRIMNPNVAQVHWKSGQTTFKLEGITNGVTLLVITYRVPVSEKTVVLNYAFKDGMLTLNERKDVPEETEVIRYVVRASDD